MTVMLVTSFRWWLYDWFEMLVAESLCWWFSQCIKSATNISKLSPTYLVSNICHQHRCNPYYRTIIGIFKWQRLIIARLMIFEKCIPWDGNDRVDTQQQDGFWVILYYSWRWLIWYESYHTWVIWWVIWWVIPWVMIHMASKWKPI